VLRARLEPDFSGHIWGTVSIRHGSETKAQSCGALHRRKKHPQANSLSVSGELRADFERVKGQPTKLFEFHQQLAKLKFLDPACGCGNFLVIAYRELRLLELDILRVLRQISDAFP
jgi:hypothetical protein